MGPMCNHPCLLMTRKNLPIRRLKKVQNIIGSILYYARAVDMMVLMVLSTIASEQITGMENTMEKAYQVLDYLATHPDGAVQFQASNMVINIHLDALYLKEPKACSRAHGHFFMGSLPHDRKPIKLNSSFHTLCAILQSMVTSAAEAKLGVLFLNCQEGMIF
jgi:hypothetical protein